MNINFYKASGEPLLSAPLSNNEIAGNTITDIMARVAQCQAVSFSLEAMSFTFAPGVVAYAIVDKGVIPK